MSRRLHLLILSAMLALALGALPASAFAAGGFSAEKYPAALAGTTTSGTTLSFQGGTSTITCATEFLTGSLSASSETLSLSPEWSGCTLQANAPVVFAANGCSMGWSIVSTGGQDAVVCPAGHEMRLTTYSSKEQFEKGNSLCEFTVPSQTLGGSLTLTGEGTGPAATISAKLSGTLTMTSLKGSRAICYVDPGQQVAPHITANREEKAFVDEVGKLGKQVGLVSGKGGVYMAGQASGNLPEQPRFETEAASGASLAGAQTASTDTITFGSGVRGVSCANTTYSGQTPHTATELQLYPTYVNCTASPGSLEASITTGGCRYQTQVLNAGPPYSGTWGIKCVEPTSAVQVTVAQAGNPLCVYALGQQQGLAGVSLSTNGYGVARDVEANLNVKGATATVLKGTKIACGAAVGGTTSAVFSGGLLLGAS